MSDIYKTGEWLQGDSSSIIEQWLSDSEVVAIFKKHKISLKKFSAHFAVGIIEHAVNVIQERKEMADCPSMNKFVDLMLQKDIRSNEILIICVTLRRTVFENLRDQQAQFLKDPHSITNLLKIFDTNLLGVFKNFDRQQINRNEKEKQAFQKELETLKNLAYKDTLTELDNLRGFEEYLEKKLKTKPDNNLKILMISLNGLGEYNTNHSKKESESILLNVTQILKEEYEIYAARIANNRFAIISDDLTLENSNELLADIDNALVSLPDTQHINTNAAIILLHDKDTSTSIIERGELLLNSIVENEHESIVDDNVLNEKEQERLREQIIFLSQMQHSLASNSTINIVNYYMEIPIQSSAKILDISKNEMTISVRKISAISLYVGDYVFIDMPQNPNFRAKVKEINLEISSLTLEHFEALEASALDRRNIHVKLKNPLEVLVKSDKIQILEQLTTVSISTFVLQLHYLYDIKVDSKLRISAKLIDHEEEYIGKVVKIIPVENRFKLIVHLEPNPNIEKSLVPFVSQRQLEIIKELQQKASQID